MKNTTSKKLRLITILFSAALLTSLLIWQQSQSNIIKKQTGNQAVTLKSTTLAAEKLLKFSLPASPSNDGRQVVQVTSLQGTQADGGINLDDQGHIKVDKDLHRLFDYYLSTMGEQDLQLIKKQLLMSASDYLSLDQLEQLRDYFDQYVQYLESTENFAISLNEDEPLEQRLIKIKSMRVAVLGQEMADGFFAEEHAYADWVLNQDQIATNELTEQQIKWLHAENQATAYQDVLLQNQQFESDGTNEHDKQIKRIEIYGEQVAARLAALESQQSQWHNKVQEYLNLRALLSDESGLQSLHSQYSNSEIKRLNAYWRQHIAGS